MVFICWILQDGKSFLLVYFFRNGILRKNNTISLSWSVFEYTKTSDIPTSNFKAFLIGHLKESGDFNIFPWLFVTSKLLERNFAISSRWRSERIERRSAAFETFVLQDEMILWNEKIQVGENETLNITVSFDN